ncbi:restriction endonuclease subunit S [Rhodococcus artemisiae]|uniref:Restriction endonuclease subunit S n=1 Tax=Rhodococcus artemisiae TaxID=714159 RepID=A0ABU7L9Q2_9NOCA|nr:restriction endonuclease subunit S [Rhodococcus artemisiae]MEE2058027.1 restriction endonuclease subunit S [Rhodococcus artemisiae]
MSGTIVPLAEVAEVKLGRQRSPKNHDGPNMRKYLRAANVGWSGLLLDDVKEMNFTDTELAQFRLEPGDILLNEASGSPREVGKPALWQGELDDCAFQNTLLRVRPSDQVDSRYLLHFFRREAESGEFVRGSRGTGINHLGRAALAQWSIPLPPIEEQRRIAAILDHADVLRAKRREALARLDELTQSIFIDMFGDPATNPAGWETARMGEICGNRFRNGLSPSKSGKVHAKVLTLSAVTGSEFDESAFKVSTFESAPPAGQSVTFDDLLICRGNGNLGLANVPLAGRPFRAENGVVVARRRRCSYGPSRPWISLRVGTGHVPFSVAVTTRSRARGSDSFLPSGPSGRPPLIHHLRGG